MSEKKKWFLYLAGLEFFYWVAFASYTYLTVYLKSLGYDATQVSLITTVISVVALISTPLMGTVADKIKSSSKTLIICMVGLGITYAMIPITFKAKILMLLFVVVSRFFYGPCQSLMEGAVVKGCDRTGNDYGKARLFGSSSWVIMSVILGSFIVSSNSGITFFLLGIFLIPCVFLALKIMPVSDDKSSGKKVALKDLPYGKLLKNPYFISFIVFMTIFHIPQMMNGTFQPFLLSEVGADPGTIGYVQAYRASFEIPTLFLSAKIQKRIPLKNMVIIAAILTAAQSILFGFVNSFAGIIAFSTLAGIAQGFNIAGMFKFVFVLAPKELHSTAQTINGASTSFASILCNAVGAMLVGPIGVKGIYLMSGILLMIACVLYIFSFPFYEKVLHIPFVDYSKEEA